MTQESKWPEIKDIFTKKEIHHLNRNSFFKRDWNADYKDTIEIVLRNTGLQSIPPELEIDWQQFLKSYTEGYIRQIQIKAEMPSSIVVGNSMPNEARREKLMSLEQSAYDRNKRLAASFYKKVRIYRLLNNESPMNPIEIALSSMRQIRNANKEQSNEQPERNI